MSSQTSSWEWLKTTLAERLGEHEMAAIWAEYNHRADVEELEFKRRRYQRQLVEATERFKATGHRTELRAIERLQRWLARVDEQLAAIPRPAVRLLEREAGTE